MPSIFLEEIEKLGHRTEMMPRAAVVIADLYPFEEYPYVADPDNIDLHTMLNLIKLNLTRDDSLREIELVVTGRFGYERCTVVLVLKESISVSRDMISRIIKRLFAPTKTG